MPRWFRGAVSSVMLGMLACGGGGSPGTGSRPTDEVDAGTPPPLDPALFDCTSLGRPPLPRRAATTPECLRDPTCKGMFVAGHRGAGGALGRIAPEDTLASYRAAIAMGVDFVETDPRPTKDGILVNFHDPSVERTTDGVGSVDELTYEELSRLRLKTEGFAGDFACERIPTLEEVLATSRGRAIVLIDANKADDVEAMIDAVRRADAFAWAVFDTDSTDKIDRALALESSVMIMPRVKQLEQVAPLLARYASHPPVLFEIDGTMFPKGVREVQAANLRVFTDVFFADYGVRAGGDRAIYRDYFMQGAAAVQSDLPDEVLRALGRPVPPS